MLRNVLVYILFSVAWLVAAGQEEVAERHAFVQRNTGNPYNERLIDGFDEAVKELGVEAVHVAPQNPTVEGQVELLEQLIAQKVSSISIVGNDPDALQPVLNKASRQGIKVVSTDGHVNPESRIAHVNQVDAQAIGRVLVESVHEMLGGSGQFAILSATSQSAEQNTWIKWMEEEMQLPKYSDLELLKVVYGDDLRDKSVSETEALLKLFPDLGAIVAPTSVGIAAASKVITDKGLIGKVKVTGLGLPSEMEEYILNGACPWMYLWSPIDVGYVTAYLAVALARGEVEGKEGEVLDVGRLGKRQFEPYSEGGLQILVAEPMRFDPENIRQWAGAF